MWAVVVVFSATWWVWERQAWVKTEIISESLVMEDVCMVPDRNEWGGGILYLLLVWLRMKGLHRG